MSQDFSTVIVFVPFVIIAAAVVLMVVFWIYDRVRPLIDNLEVSGVASPLQAVRAWARRLGERRRDDDDDGDEDLDDASVAMLSMLQGVSVVVNQADEVVRASPEAYTLGVVDDTHVVDGQVREAIRQVRAAGGCQRLDVTTSTPERFAVRDDTRPQDGADPVEVHGVARPNWLKVTVGRIDERLVVVLIDDVSEAIRFAQVRDSFITNVSEQLLKPTDALMELAGSLQDDALDAEQISWSAHNVRSACDRLNRMVADLLLLIQAQEPIMPSSANRVGVMAQLQAACDGLRATGEQLGVSVTVLGDESLTVNGDAGQIRAAVAKLVHNAIVYSKRGGDVRVSVARSADGAQAVIRVLDQGVGIAKDEQARIFERFYRGANQTQASREGIGLGLAIVKHVALTHHGGVTVWSAPGNGSTFTLMLPLAV